MPSLLQRLARITPYFRNSRPGLALGLLAAAVAAATEPVIPALLQPLLDSGFGARSFPLWWVPVVIIGLYLLRGVAAFMIATPAEARHLLAPYLLKNDAAEAP